MLVLALAVAAAVVGCAGDEPGRGGAERSDAEAKRVSPERVLQRDPYMGVSCPRPNEFACDRVGLAVWLRHRAARVDAQIGDGERFALDDRGWSGAAEGGERRMFAGFLQPAGLIDGPLAVTPDAGPGRWIGREPVFADVRLWVVDGKGKTARTTVRVGLSAGWG